MPKYGLATILENHPVGYEFPVDKLPLHLTHIDSFSVPLAADELAQKLSQLLSPQSEFSVMATVDAMYGPEKNISVTELELTPRLAKLHNDLIDMLRSEGAILTHEEFNGTNFKPHVSIYDTRRIMPGETVTIRDISIAAKVSDDNKADRIILANIELSRKS